MDNIYELIASVRSHSPGRIAVEVQRADRVDATTYGELDDLAARVAGWLAARGCSKGDRVAILADNDARWCAAFVGVQRLGAVAVPLDTSYVSSQVGTLLEDSGARVVIAGERYVDVVRTAAGRRGLRVDVLHLGAEGPAGPPGLLPECSARREDPAVILYTSGTTADPKGVVLTHGNLLAEREAVFHVATLDANDAVLSVLPLFHALALLANLLLPFSAGARVVFLESVNTTELLRALRDRGITGFCCVPQFFYLIHEKVFREVSAAGPSKRALFKALLSANGASRRFLGVNLGPLLFRRIHLALGRDMRLLMTGGSRFDAAIGRDLMRLGFDIRQAYGLTECSGAATVTLPGNLNPEGVGPPLPGIEIRILPPEPGAEGPPAGGDGEILIRGPIVMSGYYQRPDATAAALRDGWLHTGDLGFVDSRGRLHVTGRKKDVVVLASGKNVYPEEIEAHYQGSSFIRELCVMGLSRPGEPVSERLHAVVVPDLDVMRERGIVNMGEQLRFEIEGLSVGLPAMKRILSYDVETEPLARTTTRKLKRFEIQRRVAARRSGGASAATPAPSGEEASWMAEPDASRTIGLIRGAIRPGTPVSPHANLELDLGLDSMERVELLTSLEHALGVHVGDEAARTIYTVRELVEALRAASPVAPREGSAPWEAVLQDAPAVDEAFAELDRTNRVVTLVSFLFARTVCLWARVMWGFHASGLDNLPARGPFILSPNHQSYLDAFLLVGALPYGVFRRLFFVGASEHFATPLRRWLAARVKVVPVDPDSNLVRAMRAGAYGLRRGRVLILFPEGERSIDGAVKKFKKGAAILSLHLSVPIVPVAMDGVFELWPRNRSPRWRALLPGSGLRVLLRVGSAIDPGPPPAGDLSAPVASKAATIEQRYAAATDRLRASVLEMWEALRALRVAARRGPEAG